MYFDVPTLGCGIAEMLRVTREFLDTLYIIILSVITVDSSWISFNGYCSNNKHCRLSSDMADVIYYCVYFYYVIYLHTVCSEGDRLNGNLIIQYISRGKTLGRCLRAIFNRIRRISLGGRKYIAENSIGTLLDRVKLLSSRGYSTRLKDLSECNFLQIH